MINKIYEIFKKILKFLTNGVVLSIINIILIGLILTSLFVELPYGVYMPGGATSVIKQLSNVTKQTSGDIRTTHVSFIGGDILTIIGAFFIPNWDIIKIEEMNYSNEDLKSADIRRKIEMRSSADIATILAYEKAGIELKTTKKTDVISYIYEEAKTNLRTGDILLKYDGTPYSSEGLLNHTKSLSKGDTITFTVLRDDKEVITKAEVVEIEGEKYIGILISTLNEFEKGTVIFNPNENESGASGGLMLTLAIYNSIIEEDITKGKRICGTGTIDLTGTVGEISGVKYKVMGADKDECDVFLVPEANYQEAINTKKKFKYDLEIKSVNTFDDALNFLTK